MSTVEFNEMLVKYHNPLQFFALKLTADEEQAQDLLQDTMLKALTYREKLISGTSFKGWLYTIMKNTFINNYRRGVKYNEIMEKVGNSTYLTTGTSEISLSPDRLINIRNMEDAIDELSEDYSKPFKMKLQGFKYKEIGDEMGIPIGTVKSRIFLARKQLMKRLEEFSN
ncbi:RNA polymerase sigma factor [bacterium SCSIO 12741]|nr:RNA polymerase sigma factor [bacterium SCSIO 12741]